MQSQVVYNVFVKKISHFFRHLLTPHHSNNHRAKALHPKAFFYYIVFFVVVQLSFNVIHFVRPDILGFATNITIDNLLKLTNEERQRNGLSTLTLNPELSLAAEKKAEDMLSEDYWAHNSPSGKTPWDFIVSSGYQYLYAGENLAKDFSDSNGVVTAWMNSPSHKENILRGEYRDIGFAVVNGTLNGHETTLVVQIFGASKNQTVVQKPEEKAEEIAVKPTEAQTAGIIINTLEPTPIISAEKSANAYYLGVVSNPLVDEGVVLRAIALSLMGFLLFILALDGFLIIRRKTVRVAGHNMAHFIFLLALFGVILISSSGTIL